MGPIPNAEIPPRGRIVKSITTDPPALDESFLLEAICNEPHGQNADFPQGLKPNVYAAVDSVAKAMPFQNGFIEMSYCLQL